MKAGSLHSARGRYENDCMKYESLNIEYKSPTIVLYGWLLGIAELQSIRIVEIYSLDAIGKEVSYM
jgi:hypothetical protein